MSMRAAWSAAMIEHSSVAFSPPSTCHPKQIEWLLLHGWAAAARPGDSLGYTYDQGHRRQYNHQYSQQYSQQYSHQYGQIAGVLSVGYSQAPQSPGCCGLHPAYP